MWLIFGQMWMAELDRAGQGPAGEPHWTDDLLLAAMAVGAVIVPAVAVVEWLLR